MIVGHFLLAFSAVALYAHYKELDPDYALFLGLLAGGFAVLPDIDLLYAAKEIVVLLNSGMTDFVSSFWQSSSKVHRGLTHSLVVSFIGAIMFSAYFRTRSKLIAGSTLVMGGLTGLLFGSYLSAGIMLLYCTGGLAMTHRSFDIIERGHFLPVAMVSLISHPLGDTFTGTPPEMFFPLNIDIIGDRMMLSQDPVLNLLIVFFIEFSLVAISMLTIAYIKDYDMWNYIKPYSLLGIFYGPVALVITPPTLEVAYQFVFSVLGVGLLVAMVSVSIDDRSFTNFDFDEFLVVSLNFVPAVIMGSVGYLIFYLLF